MSAQGDARAGPCPLAPGVRDWKRLSEEERNLMIDLGYVDPEEFADESDGD